MKSLLLFSFLLSSAAMATAHQEVIQLSAAVGVYGLSCQTPIYGGSEEEKVFTVLSGRTWGQYNGLDIMQEENGPIELEHLQAVVEGCDKEALRAISRRAQQSYYFPRLAITVIKNTSESYIIEGQGCVEVLSETLQINLGHGIIVESVKRKLRKANDCK